MRRAERPGPGKGMSDEILWLKDIVEGNFNEIGELKKKAEELLKTKKFDSSKLHVDINLADIKEWQEVMSNIQEELKAIKEGRVLSPKDRQIIKDAMGVLQAVLKTDVAGKEEKPEEEIEIVEEKHEDEEQPDMEAAVKEALSKVDLKDVIKVAVEEDLDRKRGKVK